MNLIIGNPGRYVQGAGAIREIGQYISALELGNKALVIGGRTSLSKTQAAIVESFKSQGITQVIETFAGEVTRREIDRLAEVGKENQVNFVVGVGGGKAIDTSKGVSITLKEPLVVVPTVAATDAACSALVAIFSEEHVFTGSIFRPRNPELVVVTTDIIIKAPVRFLVAGMGDALSTKFEVEAAQKSGIKNFHGGGAARSSLGIARWCTDTILEYGEEAKRAAEQGMINRTLESVVEAVIFASSVSFENCAGLAAAHAMTTGFTILQEVKPYLHGELVGFFTLAQIVLEKQPKELVNQIFKFCHSIGLPVTLAEIGLKNGAEELIMRGAQASCQNGSRIHNEPFTVTVQMLYEALKETDRIGSQIKE
jgi:glycerol dehydrogenase